MPNLITAYETAIPNDDRVKHKQMFGSPCVFVNRQMFFGTFADTLVVRVGPARVTALANEPEVSIFSPSEGKVWDDYVQLKPTFDSARLAQLAAEALVYAAALPKNGKPPKRPKK